MEKSWRDVIKVHPSADVFPMLPEDELRQLGEDIQANGLKEPIVVWSRDLLAKDQYVLDGRNRLAAMELVGIKISINHLGNLLFNDEYACECVYGFQPAGLACPPTPDVDPYAYVISKNIRRRHLTKEQQADLIVKVMKADPDLATVARSVKPGSDGKLTGSTKDPVKAKAVETAAKADISKRTIERAMAKAEGKAPAPRKPAQKRSPEREIAIAAVPIIRDILEIDRKAKDKRIEETPEPVIPPAMTVSGAVNLITPFIDKVMKIMSSREEKYGLAVEIRRLGFRLEEEHRKKPSKAKAGPTRDRSL